MAEQKGGFDAIATIDADALRETFKRTMVLGLPSNVADQPTFYFERVVTWADYDRDNKPWDWTAAPLTEENKPAVSPICAYEFFAPLGRQGATYTEVGEFNPTTVVVTFTDDEFAKVEDSSYMTIGPSDQRWYFRYYRPQVSLGSLGVFQAHFVAQGGEG
jgi:hypothetical protein